MLAVPGMPRIFGLSKSGSPEESSKQTADTGLKRALLGAWFNSSIVHLDPVHPTFRLRSISRLTYGEAGDVHFWLDLNPGDPQNGWETSCLGVGTGNWELHGRILTTRLSNLTFQLLSLTKDGVTSGPDQARAQGFGCEGLSKILVPGTSYDDEIVEVDGNILRTQSLISKQMSVQTRTQEEAEKRTETR